MVQGDKYALEVKVTNDGTLITNENCTGIRIRLGDVEQTYPDGGITYSTESECWQFPLTQEQTYAMSREEFQIRVILPNGDIINSDVQRVFVGDSIIKVVESDD